MLFSILVGILSVFFFLCGFIALKEKDIPARAYLIIPSMFFTISLLLALACRYV